VLICGPVLQVMLAQSFRSIERIEESLAQIYYFLELPYVPMERPTKKLAYQIACGVFNICLESDVTKPILLKLKSRNPICICFFFLCFYSLLKHNKNKIYQLAVKVCPPKWTCLFCVLLFSLCKFSLFRKMRFMIWLAMKPKSTPPRPAATHFQFPLSTFVGVSSSSVSTSITDAHHWP
jgi:hypothetical protein